MKRFTSRQNMYDGNELLICSSRLSPKANFFVEDYVDEEKIKREKQKEKVQEKLLSYGLKEDFNVVPKTSNLKTTKKKDNKQNMNTKELFEISQKHCPEYLNIDKEDVRRLRISREKLLEKSNRTDKEILSYILRDTKELLNTINKSQNIISSFYNKRILTGVLVDFAFQAVKDNKGNIKNNVIVFIDFLDDIDILREINKTFEKELGKGNYTIVVGDTDLLDVDNVLKEEGLDTTVEDILNLRKGSNGYLFFEASFGEDGYLYHDGSFVETNFYEEDWDAIYPKEKEILENVFLYFCEMYKDTAWKEAYKEYLYKYLLL